MARKPKPLTKDRLAAIVSTQIEDADLFDGSDREGVREWALRFFEGEVDIPSMGEGRSSIVSRDVADTHGIILPGLIRTFFASDRVVVYEPTKTIHEEYADLATDYVNYVVMRECNGYREFRNAFWDGLLLGNGIVKFWWDDTPEYDIEEFTELDDEQYALLMDGLGEDDEVLEDIAYPVDGEPSEAGDTDPDAATGEDGDALVADDAEPAEDVEEEDDDTAPAPALGAPQLPQPPQPPAAMPAPPQPPMAAMMAALGGMGMMAPTQQPMLHDVKIRRLVTAGRLRLRCIPGEEFLLDRNATTIDETARFIAHKYTATRSQLIEDGYDAELVKGIPSHQDIDDIEDTIRDQYRWYVDKAPDESTELIEVFECYILVDADGDGIAERRRVIMAGAEGGRKLLLDEPWSDDVPFADIVPEPRPHTWRGRGLYEKIGDLQRIKTVGWRGVLDNLYMTLVPAVEVEENAYVNIDAVYDRKFGDVLIRRAGKNPIAPVRSEFIAPNVVPLLDNIDAVTEKRTGVSVRSQSQNVDALQNQSATAANIAQSAMHSKVDEYAQNIANCGGMARIFKAILKLFVRHQDRARKLRIAGKEVEVDPRAWDAGMDVVVNTGLGTGNRDRDVQALMAVVNEQKGAIQALGGDPFNPILNIGHVFDTLRKMAESTGLRNADAHFPVITQEQVQMLAQQRAQATQNGQPNPMMMQAQAQIQAQQMKAQADMALKQQKAQFDAQMEMAQAQFDAQLQREREQAKLAFEAQMNQMKMALQQQMQDAEIRMMEREAALKAELQRREMELEAMLTREANVMKNARVVQNPVADTNIRGV